MRSWPASSSRAGRYVPASPARSSPPPGAGSPAPGEYVVQVIDPAGRVRGGSADAGTTPLLSRAADQPGPPARVRGDQVGRGRAGARDGQAAGCGTRAGSRWPASTSRPSTARAATSPANWSSPAWCSWPPRDWAATGWPGRRCHRSSGCGARSPALSARDPAPGLQVPADPGRDRRARCDHERAAGPAAGLAGPAAGPGRGRQPRAAHPLRGAARRAGAGRPPGAEPGGTRGRGGPGQRGGRAAGAHHRAAAVPRAQR